MNKCSVELCNKEIKANTFCEMHYFRMRRYGRINRVNREWNTEERKNRFNLYAQLKRFDGLREVVIKRDSEKCCNCGMTRNDHKKTFGLDITVDHIDGNGMYSEFKNNTIENLQTLCLPCHGSKDGKRNVSMKGGVKTNAI